MKNKQKGLTLLELIIAVALGLVIISGVVKLVGRTMDSERLLAAEADIQETMNYVHNRLGFVFKAAISSPCGDLDKMMASSENPTVSQLKRALVNGAPQQLDNIIVQATALPTVALNSTIRQEDFLLLAVGKQGWGNEPKMEPTGTGTGPAFSTILTGIVPESEYIIVMESSDKIILNLGEDAVRGVTGGYGSENGFLASQTTPGDRNIIPTSPLKDGGRQAFIITDCSKGDVFMADSTTSRGIRVPAGLEFSSATGGYKSNQTIISPIQSVAYYTSEIDGVRQLSKLNLSGGAPLPLVSGVTEITYEWGLGDPDSATVQGYFTTKQITRDNTMDTGQFREHLINVRATITTQGVDNTYTVNQTDAAGNPVLDAAGDQVNEPLEKTVQRIYTIRNKMSRI